MKQLVALALALSTSATWACENTTHVVRNTSGQTQQVITPASATVSRITTPDGRVQGYIHHSTGRITTPSGAVTGYTSKR